MVLKAIKKDLNIVVLAQVIMSRPHEVLAPRFLIYITEILNCGQRTFLAMDSHTRIPSTEVIADVLFPSEESLSEMITSMLANV